MTKLKSLAIAAATAFSVAGIGAGAIHAAQPANGTNRMSALVSAVAQKFNLNPTDVQQVFDAQRTQDQAQRQAQHEQSVQTMLTQAIKDGTLTQAQADLISAKEKEVTAFMTTLKDKTPADRMTAMKTEMTAVQQWAKDNNIPAGFQRFVGGGGIRGGRGGMGFGGEHRGMMRGPGMGRFQGQPTTPTSPTTPSN